MSVSSRKPIVVLGELEPVVQFALRAAWRECMELHECAAGIEGLVEKTTASGANAVVVRPREVLELVRRLRRDVLIVGLTITSTKTVICLEGHVSSYLNPSVEALADLVTR